MPSQNTIYPYDRVSVLVNNEPYHEYGSIINFHARMTQNTKQQHTMTPDGLSLGTLLGNSDGTMTWTEVLPSAADYVVWKDLLQANPNTIISVIPITLSDGQPVGPNLQVTGIGVTDQDFNAAGEGESIKTTVTFTVRAIKNLNQ